jgi:hypothetical protein
MGRYHELISTNFVRHDRITLFDCNFSVKRKNPEIGTGIFIYNTVKFPEPECKIFDKKTAKNLVPLSLLSVLIHVCLHAIRFREGIRCPRLLSSAKKWIHSPQYFLPGSGSEKLNFLSAHLEKDEKSNIYYLPGCKIF